MAYRANMLTKQEIIDILQAALGETFADTPEKRRGYGPDEVLLGPGGVLDSYDAMLFLVNVDSALSDRSGRDIVLVNDAALSRESSPFRTLNSFADYIGEIIRS